MPDVPPRRGSARANSSHLCGRPAARHGQIDAVLASVDEDPSGRPLSVLVNNAGISLNAPIETLSLADWRQQFDVNLFGHVAMTRTLLPALLASQGRVVNVSSIGGLVALPTYGAYAASKFAMEAFSDVLRREVGRFGVTVIVIEPGTIATGIWGKQSAAMRELSAAWTPDWHARYDSLQEGGNRFGPGRQRARPLTPPTRRR